MTQKGSAKIKSLSVIFLFFMLIFFGLFVYYYQDRRMQGKLNAALDNLREEAVDSKEDKPLVQESESKDDETASNKAVYKEFSAGELGVTFKYPQELGVYSKVQESNLLPGEVDRGITYKFQKPFIYVSFEEKGFRSELKEEETKTTPDKVFYRLGGARTLLSHCNKSYLNEGHLMNCEEFNLGRKRQGVLREEITCHEDAINANIICYFQNNLIFETENDDYPWGLITLNLGIYDYQSNCDNLDKDRNCFKTAEVDYSEVKKDNQEKIDWLYKIFDTFEITSKQ
ncbi:MAG: hypothetical protein GF347_04560 [Candidatus Moranbacteria bacterium]|nr:hypothetical protein [Candidatus Moranbacteria bacterium]